MNSKIDILKDLQEKGHITLPKKSPGILDCYVDRKKSLRQHFQQRNLSGDDSTFGRMYSPSGRASDFLSHPQNDLLVPLLMTASSLIQVSCLVGYDGRLST